MPFSVFGYVCQNGHLIFWCRGKCTAPQEYSAYFECVQSELNPSVRHCYHALKLNDYLCDCSDIHIYNFLVDIFTIVVVTRIIIDDFYCQFEIFIVFITTVVYFPFV